MKAIYLRATVSYVAVLSLASACAPTGFDADRSAFFVVRNLFEGSNDFPVTNARAFQYGSLHVDGPDGGMVYRFHTSHDGAAWLIDHWGLMEVKHVDIVRPGNESFPGWWRPLQEGAASYTMSRDVDGGRRQLTLVWVPAKGEAYIDDQYVDYVIGVRDFPIVRG